MWGLNTEPVTAFFSRFPTDLVVIFILIVALTALTLQRGTVLPRAIALSLPLTYFVLGALEGAAFMGGFTTSALVFAAVFAAAFFLVVRFLGSAGSGAAPFSALLTASAAAVIVIIVWSTTPTLEALWQFSGGTESLFADAWKFWWLTLSYTTLAFTR